MVRAKTKASTKRVPIPSLDTPLISAVARHWQLLEEESRAFESQLATINTPEIQAKAEQRWNFQGGMGQNAEGLMILVVSAELWVKLLQVDSGVQIASYHSRARMAFEVVGTVGRIDPDKIPAPAIRAYLASAADRTADRCEQSFVAMSLPVQIERRRSFDVAPSVPALVKKKKPRVRGKK